MKLFYTLLVYSLCVLAVSGNKSSHIIPSSVNIGVLLSFNSTIGRVAKPAIEAAVEAVNSNENILSRTRLNMVMKDTKCDRMIGMIEGLNLMQNQVVAILGPQSSDIARLISEAAKEVQVPVISFAATDPDLNSTQFPYFIQATHNDYSQMSAVADLVEYFEWRKVAIIYIDSEYGRSGMHALEDVLQSGKDSDIVFNRAPLMPNASTSEIDVLLFNLNSMGSRVFIVHFNSVDKEFGLFSAAKRLGMMANGYAWVATDWLSTALDSSEPVELFNTMEIVQGVISLRRHIPDSVAKRNFDWTWIKTGSSGLNSHAYSAYDSVWIVAEAIHRFLNEQEEEPKFSATGRLKNLEIFQGGSSLLRIVLTRTNFTGLTGQIRFNSDRTIANSTFEVINVEGTGSRVVGYWSKSFGLSLLSPDILHRKSLDDPTRTTKKSHQLHGVVWPGESLIKPKESAIASTRKTLRIGVPYRVDFKNIVTIGNDDGNTSAKGYCIDIFKQAIGLLPDPPSYSFVVIGNGIDSPNYDELIKMVANDSLDAVVGDIAIVASRTLLVDFTQPFMDSGLVIIAPFRKINVNAWAFLRPFSVQLWSVIGFLFLFVGLVIWILEHRVNEDFRGPPRRQITTVIWFSLSTMFQSQRQTAESALGRIVLLIWFFVVLILNSNYVASLTSILTVQHMTSPVKGIHSLLNSSDPIGFHSGTGIENFLNKRANVSMSRLKPLKKAADYVKALELGPKEDGGVAAIIEQIPYAKIFTARHCKFKIIDDRFKRGRWGFAFQKGSPLVKPISTAILEIIEIGDLQRISDKWELSNHGCSADSDSITSNKQNLQSFWGLFLMCGVACCLALLIFFARLLCQYRWFVNSRDVESSPFDYISDRDGCKRGSIKNAMVFLDKKEDLSSVRKGKSSRGGENVVQRFDQVPPSLTDGSIQKSN
ncbi:Glutamate receptor [Zostera marina]|uniref:Glutamate receptor n=1 Tax=Zostera marina TaxID=29655 RepID=A0A0K9P868_ZOSMR|nr:Glutamate receptor [Zostera marina]